MTMSRSTSPERSSINATSGHAEVSLAYRDRYFPIVLETTYQEMLNSIQHQIPSLSKVPTSSIILYCSRSLLVPPPTTASATTALHMLEANFTSQERIAMKYERLTERSWNKLLRKARKNTIIRVAVATGREQSLGVQEGYKESARQSERRSSSPSRSTRSLDLSPSSSSSAQPTNDAPKPRSRASSLTLDLEAIKNTFSQLNIGSFLSPWSSPAQSPRSSPHPDDEADGLDSIELDKLPSPGEPDSAQRTPHIGPKIIISPPTVEPKQS